jgi:hypothetical protein
MGEGCVKPHRDAVVVRDRVEDRVARRRRERSVYIFAFLLTLKGAACPVCANAHHLPGIIGFWHSAEDALLPALCCAVCEEKSLPGVFFGLEGGELGRGKSWTRACEAYRPQHFEGGVEVAGVVAWNAEANEPDMSAALLNVTSAGGAQNSSVDCSHPRVVDSGFLPKTGSVSKTTIRVCMLAALSEQVYRRYSTVINVRVGDFHDGEPFDFFLCEQSELNTAYACLLSLVHIIMDDHAQKKASLYSGVMETTFYDWVTEITFHD